MKPFVGDGISGSGFNWNEVLFGFAEQGTISYCIKNMAPRVEFTSYSTKGFRGSLFPTWDCVSRYYTKNGLPWQMTPRLRSLIRIPLHQVIVRYVFTGIVIRAFMPLLALIVEIMTCRERQ